ncbi:ATP-binding protein [Heliorestis convoluta]|uniref:IstB-like ATP binding protein n=1 Tax=Heliorestis convoluta TaxID=356322 RepID=A0A5Q2N9L5_9FIRM|nr:ATP-binding protein [Heliorestis convoluta]QGG48960.1 IstB-like ATP binding protein [Heliorestis convoluta]
MRLADLLQQKEAERVSQLHTQQQKSNCPVCCDRGMVVDRTTKTSRTCICIFERIVKRKMGEANITPKEQLQTLDSFEFRKPVHSQMKQLAEKYIANMPTDYVMHQGRICTTQDHCLWLGGATGMGKSHLAIAIAQVAIASGHNVKVINCVRMFAEIVDCFSTNEKPKMYQEAMDATVLVLDDIFKQKPSDFVIQKIYDLVQWRVQLGLPTIYTSERRLGNKGEEANKLNPTTIKDMDTSIWRRIRKSCGDGTYVFEYF